MEPSKRMTEWKRLDDEANSIIERLRKRRIFVGRPFAKDLAYETFDSAEDDAHDMGEME